MRSKWGKKAQQVGQKSAASGVMDYPHSSSLPTEGVRRTLPSREWVSRTASGRKAPLAGRFRLRLSGGERRNTQPRLFCRGAFKLPVGRAGVNEPPTPSGRPEFSLLYPTGSKRRATQPVGVHTGGRREQ